MDIQTVEKKKWVPKLYEKYYSVDLDGEICVETWENYDFDTFCLSIGNVHENQEDAKEYKQKLIAWAKTL